MARKSCFQYNYMELTDDSMDLEDLIPYSQYNPEEPSFLQAFTQECTSGIDIMQDLRSPDEISVLNYGEGIMSTQCTMTEGEVRSIMLSKQTSKVPIRRRLIKRGECPLLKFFRKGRPPKLEYTNIMLIRALKKGMRLAKFDSKALPSAGLFRAIGANGEEKWKDFVNVVRNYSEVFSHFASTQAGPETDGKRKRDSSTKPQHLSHNKQFLLNFYSNPYIRAAHFLFTETVFCASPEELCLCFKFNCCESASHTQDCEDLWEELKQYVQVQMIEELSLQPYLG